MLADGARNKTRKSVCVSASLSPLLECRQRIVSHERHHFLCAEYQVDAQPLRPCELQRERAFARREDYVPQCAEDGSFQ